MHEISIYSNGPSCQYVLLPHLACCMSYSTLVGLATDVPGLKGIYAAIAVSHTTGKHNSDFARWVRQNEVLDDIGNQVTMTGVYKSVLLAVFQHAYMLSCQAMVSERSVRFQTQDEEQQWDAIEEIMLKSIQSGSKSKVLDKLKEIGKSESIAS